MNLPMERSPTNAPLPSRSGPSRSSSGPVEKYKAHSEGIASAVAVDGSKSAAALTPWGGASVLAAATAMGGAKQKAPSALSIPRNARSLSSVVDKKKGDEYEASISDDASKTTDSRAQKRRQTPPRHDVPCSLDDLLGRIADTRLAASPSDDAGNDGFKDDADFATKEDVRHFDEAFDFSETMMVTPKNSKTRGASLDEAPKAPSNKRHLLQFRGDPEADTCDGDESKTDDGRSVRRLLSSLTEFLSSVPPLPWCSDAGADREEEGTVGLRAFRIEPRFDSHWLAELGVPPTVPVEVEMLS